MNSPWWKEYFDEFYLEVYSYLDNPEKNFLQAKFIESILKIESGMRILDVGCGFGRHAILLKKMGYNVIGLDYSQVMLDACKYNACRKGVDIILLRGDMRELPFKDKAFNAAYNFYTSFGYFDDKDNIKVLREVSRVLKDDGRFLIEMINPFLLFREEKSKNWIELEKGVYLLEEYYIDFQRMLTISKKILLKHGKPPVERWHQIRIYTPSEIKNLLTNAGFSDVKFYGNWRNYQPFTLFSPRLIVVATKSKS